MDINSGETEKMMPVVTVNVVAKRDHAWPFGEAFRATLFSAQPCFALRLETKEEGEQVRGARRRGRRSSRRPAQYLSLVLRVSIADNIAERADNFNVVPLFNFFLFYFLVRIKKTATTSMKQPPLQQLHCALTPPPLLASLASWASSNYSYG